MRKERFIEKCEGQVVLLGRNNLSPLDNLHMKLDGDGQMIYNIMKSSIVIIAIACLLFINNSIVNARPTFSFSGDSNYLFSYADTSSTVNVYQTMDWSRIQGLSVDDIPTTTNFRTFIRGTATLFSSF